MCAEKNVTQKSAKISLARELIDKVHGRAWNCATRTGNRCHDVRTIEAFYASLLITVGDDAVESIGDTPFVTFLCFMSLDFGLDMDVGDYVGLKRRLIKDFLDSLVKEGVTMDEERIEIITGAAILAICPPEFLNAVNIFDKSENSYHVFKRAREEARKRACSIGVKHEETVRDRELREFYLVYFPRLLPKLGIYQEVSIISTASVRSRGQSGSTDRRQRARSPYFNKGSGDPRQNRSRCAESVSSRAPSIIS